MEVSRALGKTRLTEKVPGQGPQQLVGELGLECSLGSCHFTTGQVWFSGWLWPHREPFSPAEGDPV